MSTRRAIRPAGAAGNWSSIERAFGGAKVWHGQRTICADYSDQRYAMKIVAFGEHLRADENIQHAVGKSAERFLILALGARGVAIQRAMRAFGNSLHRRSSSCSEPSPKK